MKQPRDGQLEGLVHRHGVRAAAHLIGVTRAGHVADAETVGSVVGVGLTAPALSHAGSCSGISMQGGMSRRGEDGTRWVGTMFHKAR